MMKKICLNIIKQNAVGGEVDVVFIAFVVLLISVICMFAFYVSAIFELEKAMDIFLKIGICLFCFFGIYVVFWKILEVL